MKKISSTFTSIFLVLFISNTSYIFLTLITLLMSNKDVKIVNYTGILRGGIQRIVKLELAKENTALLREDIDVKLEEVNSYRNRVSIFNSSRKKFDVLMSSIKKDWKELKNEIALYKDNPGSDNFIRLRNRSELLWKETNDLVFMVQHLSQNKNKYFYLLLIVVLANSCLIVFIMYLMKKIIKDKLEYYAYYDFLTNCLNRRAFDETVSKEIELAKRYNRMFFLILFDIDFFKKINDTFGHDVGDYVLKRLTKIINDNVRSSDIFGRVGGEEFMIINFDNKTAEVKKFAERLRSVIEMSEFKGKIGVTISVGVTKFRGFHDTKDQLFKRADKALYKAKYAGRNRVIFDF